LCARFIAPKDDHTSSIWKLTDFTRSSFFRSPEPPARPSGPEATGLRHLAFEVDNIDEAIAHINAHGVIAEPIRVDEFTGKRFTFFQDPDGLPIEFYEI
jgi:glyoxylase I family protein